LFAAFIFVVTAGLDRHSRIPHSLKLARFPFVTVILKRPVLWLGTIARKMANGGNGSKLVRGREATMETPANSKPR